MPLIVDSLYLYPIKSFSGLKVNHARLDALGFEFDRRYMLIDHQSRFVSQRKHRQLVKTSITDEGDNWRVALLGFDERSLPKQGSVDSPVEVGVWGDRFQAFDQGDEWASWFSQWLGEAVRLVYIGDKKNRQVDKAYSLAQNYVGFADGFPLLLTNKATLIELNSYLKESITMERFRPNIVVSGLKPFEELSIASIKTEKVCFELVKPCERCVIPSLSLETGESDRAVLDALKSFFRHEDGRVVFGQNVIFDAEAEIAVGEFIETSPE